MNISNFPIKLIRLSEYQTGSFDLKNLYETDAIIDHIIKSLLILKGEYIFDPNVGSKLLTLIFEPMDDDIRGLITEEIKNIVNTYPSASLDNIFLEEDRANKIVKVFIDISISGKKYYVEVSSRTDTRSITVNYNKI